MDVEAQAPWRELARITEEGSPQQVEQFLKNLPDGEVAHTLSRLSEEECSQVLTALSPEEAADLVERLSDAQALEVIERLPPQTAAAILDELPSNEQADLIADLERSGAEAILAEMDPAEAADARTLSRYADDVAGGLMVTEFLRYREDATVGEVVEDMRDRADEYRDYDVQYAYVCDRDDRLTGVLRLRDLLLAPRSRPIADLMIRRPESVRDDTSLDDLADFFDRHHYLGVPAADKDGRLVGVVRKAAVDEAWAARQDSDFLKTQGIVGGEELRTMPLGRRASRRLSWLSVNILLNILAASVIAFFQDTLSAVIALAVFLPIISDMSGCSGNQAVAVSLRELSLGLVRPNEMVRVWLKEIGVGLINGAALGLLIGGVAWLWQGNAYLGLVVGVALGLNTMVAVSIGGVVPLVLKRFSVDPAIASGPLLTTVTDMCGFFFILGIATMLLPQLGG
ncbi:MAG: magnesium transporter [Planctomycetes bacterium]|nr:magnesium transporter [Planctomycetota bacterium]